MRSRQFSGQAHLAFAVAAVFVATFTLLYIFTAISQTADSCKTNPSRDVCMVFNGIGLPIIVLVVIIAGLILTILTVAYILISA